jgi:hypothetical protein
MPEANLDWIAAGKWLLAQKPDASLKWYSQDMGLSWQILPVGDLSQTWVGNNSKLCMVIDEAVDALICSTDWIRKNIPGPVSSEHPILSGLGDSLILADGFNTYIQASGSEAWESYGSKALPQITQVFDLDQGYALALAAFPGWKNQAGLTLNSQSALMGTADQGKTWSVLNGFESQVWNLAPVRSGDTVLLASISGDLHAWDLKTGAVVDVAYDNGSVVKNQNQPFTVNPNVLRYISTKTWSFWANTPDELQFFNLSGQHLKTQKMNLGENLVRLNEFTDKALICRSNHNVWLLNND